MNRREFIKDSAVVAGAVALGACTSGRSARKPAAKLEIGDMTCRTNPNNSDSVSLLGYGCMRWPRVEAGNRNSPLDQDQINHLVDTAIEHGVNYFDTAPVYCDGKSEYVTGLALSRHDRSKWMVATKMSNFSPNQRSREASIAIYKKSLSELGVDYIDYYLLHAVGSSMDDFKERFIDNGILDFLVKEKKAGKIRNLGFSFHGQKEVFDHMMQLHDKGEYHWDFVQIQMNYVDWEHARMVNPRNCDALYLYKELESREIPVVIMEPLLGGRLASMPERITTDLQNRDASRSIASWAFRFCGTYPGVLTVLSGMTYMEHLEDNLVSFCPLVPLSQPDFEFLADIADVLVKYPTVPCTACAYCMPCPYGLDIPSLMQHYNKCVNEGLISENTGDPSYRELRRKYLSSYGEAVPAERQADKCIGCGKCLEKCPQNIDIPRELAKMDRYVEKLRRNG